MSNKHTKSQGHNPHSQPNQTSTAEQKRTITGDVHVRGDVTVETGPGEALARKAQTDKQDSRDRKRLTLEVVSLFVLALYAGLTLCQARSSQKSADAAESAALTATRALDSSNRSWIEARLSSPWEEESTTNAAAQELLRGLNQVIVPFELTNIGHVPVTDVQVESKVELLDRNEMPHLDYSGRRATLFNSILYPTRTIHLNTILYASGTPSRERDVPTAEMTSLLSDDLKSGQKYIAAYGRGTFSDALGEHWFQFCRWISFADPKLRLAFPSRDCVDYNREGDRQKASK
jgi:hypothetical protein